MCLTVVCKHGNTRKQLWSALVSAPTSHLTKAMRPRLGAALWADFVFILSLTPCLTLMYIVTVVFVRLLPTAAPLHETTRPGPHGVSTPTPEPRRRRRRYKI